MSLIYFGCLCFLQCVFLVNSNLFNSQNGFAQRHNFQRSNCSPLNIQLSKNIQSAACKPRETMVELTSEVANIMIYPNKIPVKRCNGGVCYGQASCLPVQKRIVKYAVRKHDFSTMKEFCGVVEVEEHIKCKCGCSVMHHHCNNNQVYKTKECTCECINNDEKENCIRQGRIWDYKNCVCECPEKHSECSTGTEWVPSKCQCMKLDTHSAFLGDYSTIYYDSISDP